MFEIYLTPNGPVLIEGEQKIRTMDAVINGNCTFTEVVTYTGMAKSTVLFNLRKLVEEGMIAEEDGVYSTLSLGLIISSKVDDSDYILGKVITQSLYPDPMERYIISFPVLSAHKFGISIAPILVELGKIIGRVAYAQDTDITLEDAIEKVIRFFDIANYADVKLLSMMPLSFDVTPRFTCTDESCLTFCEIVIRMICEYLSMVTSTEYYISDLVYHDNSYRMTMGFKDVEPRYFMRYHGFEFNQDAKSDFWIYFTGESFVPVVGDLQMRIMSSMERRKFSSKELSVELGVSQTTLIGHLKKMEASKLIASERSGNKSVYHKSSDRIFAWCNTNRIPNDNRKRYLEDMWNHPEHAFRSLLHFLLVDSAYLGFDIKTYLEFMGKYVARSMCQKYSQFTAEEMLKGVCQTDDELASATIAVTSYNPLTISKITNYDMEQWVAECQMVFFTNTLSTMMEVKMGVKYAVKKEEVFGDGFRRYELVLVPDVGGSTRRR